MPKEVFFMKRLKMLSLVPALCLCSCSQSTPYGLYEFRLGKTDGAHFGVSVELLEEANPDHEGAKKMYLAADFGSDFNIETVIDEYSSDIPFLADIVKEIAKAIIPEDGRFEGYYTLTNINTSYGTRVKIGSDFIIKTLAEKYPALAEIEELYDISTPEIIEMVLCTYLNTKQITFQIPVSIADVQQQLAWYGYLIDFSSDRLIVDLDLAKLPGAQGEERIGTHPEIIKDNKGNVLVNQIDQVNQTFQFEFSHTFLYQPDELGFPEAVGSFVTKLNEKNETVLYYSPFEEGGTNMDIEGKVYVTSFLDERVAKDIKFSYSTNSKEVSVTHNGKQGKDEGFIDSSGNEFTYSTFMEKPFTFRDFHDVRLGLAKV